MSIIKVKAVKYPKEEVIELDELTIIGLMNLKNDAEKFIEEINQWLEVY